MATAFQTDTFQNDAFEVDGGAPPVTGTATWDQAAASWAATLSERIAATATFTQEAATWSATASERYTSTAAFVQAAATWDAAALERLTFTATWTQTQTWDATAQIANPISATATFVQAAAEWNATNSQEFEATASWSQDQTWTATATESIRGVASWSDGATDYDDSGLTYDQGIGYGGRSTTTWAASALAIVPVTGTATFSQEAATWASTATERLDASAAFSQAPAAFSAEATEELPFAAEFTQAAAAWAAVGIGGVVQPSEPSGGTWTLPRPRKKPKVLVVGYASFAQQPATWHADMTTDPSLVFERADEEALLALV